MKTKRWNDKYKIIQEENVFRIQRLDGTLFLNKYQSFESAKKAAISAMPKIQFDAENYQKMKTAKQIIGE